MTGSLTVKENFMFSAALRLPSSTSWAQRKERVATVIQELGLEKCANTKVTVSLDPRLYFFLFSCLVLV